MKETYRIRISYEDRSDYTLRTFTTTVTIDESDPYTDVSDIACERLHAANPNAEYHDEEIVAV